MENGMQPSSLTTSTSDAQTQKALADSEARYRTLFEDNPSVMLLIEPLSGAIVDANPSAAAYYGWSRAELCSMSIFDIDISDRSAIEAEIARAHSEQRPRFFFQHRRADGSLRDVEVYSSPVELDGRTLRYSIVHDITLYKQAERERERLLLDLQKQAELEKQLHRQERLAAVGQLAAGIAHDFNNIMSVIMVYAEITSTAPGLSPRERGRMETIMQQADRATAMIRQILDFSRQSVYERQVVDVLPLLKEQVKLLRQTLPENIEVLFDYGKHPCLLLADATRFQQLVLNLALNARDAMPHGGLLRMEISTIRVDAQERPLLPGPGEWLRLTVSDTGCGIASEHMAHLYEPFFTTKEQGKGTGLGLAQAHGIVAQHEGHIAVESELGRGTTFTVYLPAAAPSDKLDEMHPRASSIARGSGQQILVVEDEAVLRESLVEMLGRWDYAVTAVANGEEALAYLDNVPADLILSDVIMPRLGGVALANTLCSRGPCPPIIFMSGHTHGEEQCLHHAAAVAAWLQKPLTASEVARAVAAALASAR
jgi:PAS domain S-box-containing protein